uniref:Putative secreted protein salivary gland overexpressed n=1 Tax=Rhipicephalus microplus TaxID=6941 RepID=A0A6M2D9I9_RHIMP
MSFHVLPVLVMLWLLPSGYITVHGKRPDLEGWYPSSFPKWKAQCRRQRASRRIQIVHPMLQWLSSGGHPLPWTTASIRSSKSNKEKNSAVEKRIEETRLVCIKLSTKKLYLQF